MIGRGFRVLIIIILLAGCAAWPFGRSSGLLERADRLAADGDYVAAVSAYDEFLDKYPDDRAAARARASRDTAAEMGRLRSEVVRLREQLGVREGELNRIRQELSRLLTEADRLRVDLENLKRLDLELERRKR